MWWNWRTSFMRRWVCSLFLRRKHFDWFNLAWTCWFISGSQVAIRCKRYHTVSSIMHRVPTKTVPKYVPKIQLYESTVSVKNTPTTLQPDLAVKFLPPRFGEGYFEGLWYCGDCWDSWQDAPPEMITISPWPLEAGHGPLGFAPRMAPTKTIIVSPQNHPVF